MARSTAPLCPLITTCPSALSFAAVQTSPCAASAAISSIVLNSAPIMAAMAPIPTGTARCMASPRSFNNFAVSERLSVPAAANAEYSPSE